MHALHPLIHRAELIGREHAALLNIIEQADQFMRDNKIKQCPICGVGDYVQLTHWQPINPEHDDNAIIIQCDDCGIQTKPQYWFINNPDSALPALFDAYKCWNNRPSEVLLS